MLKFSRLLIAVALLSLGFTQAVRAADGDTAYIVTYFDTAFADKDKARLLAKKFGEASQKEDGNLRFEVLQRIGQPDQFMILEAWKDKDAATAHGAAGGTREFREKLAPMLRGAYDERPHTALGVGEVKVPAAKSRGGIFAVTHVDIIPPEKDRGVNMTKDMANQSRNDKGSIRFEVLTQNNRPNHMTVIEIWNNQQSITAHAASAAKKQYRETLTPMSGSLYDERFFRQIN
jgi:quinol monooxygenase YgiN